MWQVLLFIPTNWSPEQTYSNFISNFSIFVLKVDHQPKMFWICSRYYTLLVRITHHTSRFQNLAPCDWSIWWTSFVVIGWCFRICTRSIGAQRGPLIMTHHHSPKIHCSNDDVILSNTYVNQTPPLFYWHMVSHLGILVNLKQNIMTNTTCFRLHLFVET